MWIIEFSDLYFGLWSTNYKELGNGSISHYLQKVSLDSAVVEATLDHNSGTEESWCQWIQRQVSSGCP